MAGYLFALLLVALTALFVQLGSTSHEAWYLLAVPVGAIAALVSLMASIHFLGADNANPGVRSIILCAVTGTACAIFARWGYRGSGAWYWLAVPSGLLTALSALMGYAETSRPDPHEVHRKMAEEHARWQAELRARGWITCRGCNDLQPPPADGKHCHGCGGPLRGGEYKCICASCYAAHLASD